MSLWRRMKTWLPGMRAAADYEAAAMTRRTTGWSPVASDVNTLVFRNADTLRSRSRDMVRRNPWATNALDAFVGNCIGTGIKPQSLHADAEQREQIQALWLRWTDEADAASLTDFYGLQALVCRSTIEGGECLVRIRDRRPEDGLTVPLQLQLLEAEHLPPTKNENLLNGNVIRAGIEFDKLGRVPVLKARMNPDLHMGGDLKATASGNLFVIFGEPDIKIEDLGDGMIRVKVFGVDVFKPQTGEVVSEGTDGIALWMIDTDYNEESFFVRHAYFLGANDPYKALKTTLKAEIDEEAWESLYSDTSRPFPKPASGRIAVKVINHLGDEVMKVFAVG